jgi:predicted TIM-barrel fold metal-dependent hydrolase
MGLLATAFYLHAKSTDKVIFPQITGDRRAYARKLIDANNDWNARTAREYPRLRTVGILLGDSVDELIANARMLLDKGIRGGIWMPTALPPGGVSPANPVLNPLWDMLSAEGVPLTSHVDGDYGFLASENFIQTLVLGGVFERFPRFCFGAAEVGAGWLGSCADMMDSWIQNSGVFSVGKSPVKLKQLPSDYIRQNVRVSPFGFEDVGTYIRRYGLEECYCYGSDFPHIEGGKDPMGSFVRSFEKNGFGPDALKRFFVDNAKIMMRS